MNATTKMGIEITVMNDLIPKDQPKDLHWFPEKNMYSLSPLVVKERVN
jgi:hypothetical protein